LASLAEIGLKSPYYADAIRQNDLPWIHLPFPIPDYGVPDDREAFLELVQDLVSFLQSGENVLIHCGAGIGRTGMVAICILLVAGLSESDARDRVRVSGSGPERPEQNEVVRWVAQQISRNR
jgi:protein-tyrosine phosphatase